MRRAVPCLLAAIAVGLLASAPAALSNDPAVNGIPNGHIEGRSDAKYGTYSTTVQNSAQGFQTRVLELQNKAYGLAKISQEDAVKQSELGYLLENEIVRLHQEIADAPAEMLTTFERDSLLYATVREYHDVRHHSERLYENMIRYIDHKIPGPNGQQIRIEPGTKGESLYYPNYRSDKDLSESEKKDLYAKKLEEFQAAGGTLKEIQTLNRELLRQFGEVSRLEYVWLESGEVLVTAGKAGHLLLASGGRVKSAGQLVILKSKAGQISMLIVTNASGSYKPDVLSAEYLAEKLREDFKVPADLVVVTKGEPLSTQAVKIYLKADHVDPAAIKKRVGNLEAKAKAILDPPSPVGAACAKVFSAA